MRRWDGSVGQFRRRGFTGCECARQTERAEPSSHLQHQLSATLLPRLIDPESPGMMLPPSSPLINKVKLIQPQQCVDIVAPPLLDRILPSGTLCRSIDCYEFYAHSDFLAGRFATKQPSIK